MRDTGTVYVVDDDESVGLALESLLCSVGLNVQVHKSVSAFLESDHDQAPGCIMLDVRLPGISGLSFHERAAEFGIKIPIILMTAHGDISMSVRAMKAGAVDFLTKPFRDQDVLDAVSIAIAADRVRLQHELADEILNGRYRKLSPREREVMELVVAGKMNKQVAGILGLSEITVKNHRGAAMRKMEATTLADLVKMSEKLATQKTKYD